MIVTPKMKELRSKQCFCKKHPCTCIYDSVVNSRPTAVNLSNFAFSNKEILNHLALQAFLNRQCNTSELYVSPAWNTSTQSLDSPQITSSSDQIMKERSPSSTPPKKREKLAMSPVFPISYDQNKTTTSVQEKKFTCDICQRSFAYKHVLQNHKRTHTGEKPFICKVCQKKFTRGHHLTTHLRLHTGERPYECPHCYKNFVQVANLRRHIRVHTGEQTKSPKEVKSETKSIIQPLKSHLCERFSPLGDICTMISGVIIESPQEEPEDLSIKNKKSGDRPEDLSIKNKRSGE